ncbi:4Fe-4S ferredoxin-type, iron-sulphur binding domain [Moorella glycerini]|uniref:Ferredoxin n=1 Tax=Neomoorella stamsii TaxID=1266720 RepID=A0A9X7P6N4_9FIRM|nr:MULTISPECIES: ferredoxin family protein [Moorella]PRR73569.1 ferredoxin [Moorella stamsii]CEP69338.1 4Fe-4S ferredoxin-type, iron-sulphur binding domain [Moorella glycerini]
MAIIIDEKRCNGCGQCDHNCPGDIIQMDPVSGQPRVVYPDECWYCGACRIDCPEDCIRIIFPLTSL